MVLSNPRHHDNPLEIVNAAFCALTGYAEEEIVGRNCRFLGGEGTEEAAKEQLRAAIHDCHPVVTDVLNYRSNGTPFRNGVMITPVYDTDGELAWFLGSQIDLVLGRPKRLHDAAPTRPSACRTSPNANDRCCSRWLAGF